MTSIGKTALAIAGVLVLLCAGIWMGGHPESLPDPVRDAFVDEDRALRAEVVDEIEDSFYKKVDADDLDQGALKGIVDELGDQFSKYLTPNETKLLRSSLSGRFEGVGIAVDEDRRGLKVLNVYDGTPADRAGIRKGEYITAVNGRSIAGVSSRVSTARIKGPAGTRVALEIVDTETGRRRTVKLRRAEIEVPVAEGRLVTRGGHKLGHIELTTFSSGAHGVLKREIERLRGKGAEGFVLDLRGNGGGLLDEAVLVSSIFIEDGLIVSTDGRSRPRRELEAEGDAIPSDIPVVVLVDGGSASASEIVTGALRDRERATVLGTRTFGKGVFQEVKPLSNGGVLDITVGQYFLPDGENIAQRGIKPQLRAEDNPRTERDEALPVALRTLARKVR